MVTWYIASLPEKTKLLTNTGLYWFFIKQKAGM